MPRDTSQRGESIKQTLRRIKLLTTLSAFLIALPRLTTYDYLEMSRQLLADSAVKLRLIARHSGSALLFENPEAATAVLDSLQADAQVLYASLWNEQGEQLASYHSAGHRHEAFGKRLGDGHRLGRSQLDIAGPGTSPKPAAAPRASFWRP